MREEEVPKCFIKNPINVCVVTNEAKMNSRLVFVEKSLPLSSYRIPESYSATSSKKFSTSRYVWIEVAVAHFMTVRLWRIKWSFCMLAPAGITRPAWYFLPDAERRMHIADCSTLVPQDSHWSCSECPHSLHRDSHNKTRSWVCGQGRGGMDCF